MSRKRKKDQVKGREWIIYLLLCILVVGAFLLRTIPSWKDVFVGDFVIFRETDPWYHMRLVDNMMHNFPIPLKFDHFALYPEGATVGYFPLLSWIVAIPGMVFNHEVIGAILPPIIGALTLIPVFFICRILFNHWVGLLACLLIAIQPTEFFHRSLLGFTDHHILEVFFLTLTILFLLLLQKKESLLYSILAGLTLGLYLATWVGGPLLVFLIWIWSSLLILYRLRNKKDVSTFCKLITITLIIGFIIFIPFTFLVNGVTYTLLILLIAIFTPYSILLTSKYLKDWWKALPVLGGVLIIITFFLAIYKPEIFQSLRASLPSPGSTIQEARYSDLHVLTAHFGVSFFLFLGGTYFAIRNKQNLLLIIWTLLMFILVIGQRRWDYYFTINNAIMASYLVYLIGRWVSRNTRIAAVSVACLLMLVPTIKGTAGMATVRQEITSGWYQACLWLRDNTPPQFTSDNAYYELKPEGKPSYGVLSWWDYGNWIMRIGRKVPTATPTYQDPPIQGEVFVAQSAEEANKVLDTNNIKYIVVDEAMVKGKFYAIVLKSPYKDKDPGSLWDKSFLVNLWYEKPTGWYKVYQSGEVKVYAREFNDESRDNSSN